VRLTEDDGDGGDDDGDDDGNDGEGSCDFDVADTVGKVLALVKQVRNQLSVEHNFLRYFRLQIRKSPQARAFFKQTCIEVNIPCLELLQWVRTRWASLYTFLDRILKLQKVSLRLSYFPETKISQGREPIHSTCR